VVWVVWAAWTTELPLPNPDQVLAMNDDSDDDKLASDMIDVHGREAATVARENARAAALAGQPMQAKYWIRVLGIIQKQQAGKASAIRTLLS
jgi:hypothetical protein